VTASRPGENGFEEQVCSLDYFRPGEKFFAQAIWQLRSGEDNVAQAKMALEQVCSLEYFRPSEIIFTQAREFSLKLDFRPS